jgi:hypothetical protein
MTWESPENATNHVKCLHIIPDKSRLPRKPELRPRFHEQAWPPSWPAYIYICHISHRNYLELLLKPQDTANLILSTKISHFDGKKCHHLFRRSPFRHIDRPRMFSRRLNQSQTESFSKSRQSTKSKSSFREHAVSKHRHERTRKPPTEENPQLGR